MLAPVASPDFIDCHGDDAGHGASRNSFNSCSEESSFKNCETDSSIENSQIALEACNVKYICDPVVELPDKACLNEHDLHSLGRSQHPDPFGVIGWHKVCKGCREGCYLYVYRAWVRLATTVKIVSLAQSNVLLDVSNEPVVMERYAGSQLFQKAFYVRRCDGVHIAEDEFCKLRCKFFVSFELAFSVDEELYDAYQFSTLLDSHDLELFKSGSYWYPDDLMGSHITTVDGIRGVRFAVWAPNASFVSVVGDWNGWDGRFHPMRRRFEYGVWELFIPSIGANLKYGYQIHAADKSLPFVKIDPYAQEFENPPKTASIISGFDDSYVEAKDRFEWTDEKWMHERNELGRQDLMRRLPMSIYEVHLPSWMRGQNNSYLTYREIAHRLVAHIKQLNFTHVEFLPLSHHPFEGSWGYQVTGLYAPYSRLGNPNDLKYLINDLHRHNIGVFLDVVPAHFAKDDWGLVCYDGTPCYEYADPKEGEHRSWGTKVFNFSRNEVRSFLLGAAYHWLRRYHIDGLRIDAVSSMLYKNHCRPAGEWIPNEHGGDSNIQAISLLKELNWVIHQQFPGVITMAEESTSWKGVTDKKEGLGFDLKWDLGWMNDTLSYMCTPPNLRHTKHQKLTFRALYMAHEKWVLPLSHDEVVSGKGSLIDKCGFRDTPFEDRIKNLRAIMGFQVGLPGRPLLFMGSEIGQGREWSADRSIDWHEGQEELRKRLCIWVSELMAVYRYHKALHAGDDESWNFKWIDCENPDGCVIAFLRSYMDWQNDIIVIVNFSGKIYWNYPIGCPHGGEWKVLLNSDDWRYSGTMTGPGNLCVVRTTQGGRFGWPWCLWLDLPAFSCIYLQAPQPAVNDAPTSDEVPIIQ